MPKKTLKSLYIVVLHIYPPNYFDPKKPLIFHNTWYIVISTLRKLNLKKNRKKNGKCVITLEQTLSIILADWNSTAKKIENHLFSQKT